jgi:hypothetical protein
VVRRERFDTIANLAAKLVFGLSNLDFLSRDELESRANPKKIEALIGSLLLLEKETRNLPKDKQLKGRSRDLAQERWIFDLADIYENAFGQPASAWRKRLKPTKNRGEFYRLLQLSRPKTFPLFGSLSRRQVDRVLDRREKPNQVVVDPDLGKVSLLLSGGAETK